ENGQLRAGNFYDYHAATAFDLPSFRYANVVSPSPFTPIGAKGMGEGGGAPLQAISAAIQDAVGDSAAVLDSFNPPERVLRLLRGLNAEKVKVIRWRGPARPPRPRRGRRCWPRRASWPSCSARRASPTAGGTAPAGSGRSSPRARRPCRGPSRWSSPSRTPG